jgi:hypothetical protein
MFILFYKLMITFYDIIEPSQSWIFVLTNQMLLQALKIWFCFKDG